MSARGCAREQLFPVKISETKRKFMDLDLTSEKLKKRELMHFSRQLAVFIKAGISIITALETIADEAQDKVLRRVLADMGERLERGSTFADAAAAHPEAFPAYYVGVLRSAELTGRLDETIDNLARYLDREIQARSKIVAALVYPVHRHGDGHRDDHAAGDRRAAAVQDALRGAACRAADRHPVAARFHELVHRPVVHSGRHRCRVVATVVWMAEDARRDGWSAIDSSSSCRSSAASSSTRSSNASAASSAR